MKFSCLFWKHPQIPNFPHFIYETREALIEFLINLNYYLKFFCQKFFSSRKSWSWRFKTRIKTRSTICPRSFSTWTRNWTNSFNLPINWSSKIKVKNVDCSILKTCIDLSLNKLYWWVEIRNTLSLQQCLIFKPNKYLTIVILLSIVLSDENGHDDSKFVTDGPVSKRSMLTSTPGGCSFLNVSISNSYLFYGNI